MVLKRVLGILALLAVLGTARSAAAQSASLYSGPLGPAPLSLQQTSFFFREIQPPPEIKLYDIITVVVDEKSQFISEAEVERQKRAFLNAQLQDWIRLSGLNVKPAPQFEGSPKIIGQWNSRLQTTSDLGTLDGLKFRVAATVVDIRPNGNLVLEAHRIIENNDIIWEYSLSGIVRPQDVLPNNTVLSEDVAELMIDKREQGSVRDGYRRGWVLELIDKYNPF